VHQSNKSRKCYFLKENLSCYQQTAKIQYSYFDKGNEIKAIGYLIKNSRIISYLLCHQAIIVLN
jgi:hypothetical protein